MRWPITAVLSLMALSFSIALSGRLPSRTSPAEVARVRAHLERAEAFAVTRDLSGLSPAQRAARARHLSRLLAYREHGVFPVNDVVPGRSPVFVDARGVHCAVGHLLALDGETALVERIARTRNLARIAELADEPRLIAWLDRSGLTVEEAARIQPAYEPIDVSPQEESAHRTFAAVMTGVAASGILVNLHRADTRTSRDWRSFYGLSAGIAAVASGILALDGDGAEGWASAAIVSGGASAIMSFRNRGEPKGFAISVGPAVERRGLALVRATF